MLRIAAETRGPAHQRISRTPLRTVAQRLVRVLRRINRTRSKTGAKTEAPKTEAPKTETTFRDPVRRAINPTRQKIVVQRRVRAVR
jgi:hypothetical protein